MSLQYNVSTLLQEPVGATRAYDLNDRALVDDAAPKHERVVGRATFLRTKDGVLVTAHLEADLDAECSRCLRALELPLRIVLEEEFYATTDPATGADLPAPEDPGAFVIDAKHTLDLEEAVRQYWTLALPVQPLCQPECRGLCAGCGKDLNEGACFCPPAVDERWSALREVVKQMERS